MFFSEPCGFLFYKFITLTVLVRSRRIELFINKISIGTYKIQNKSIDNTPCDFEGIKY